MTVCVVETPLGNLKIAEENGAVVCADFCEEKPLLPSEGVLLRAAQFVTAYFSRERVFATVPLAPKGTDFQKACFALLARIPFGEVTSYGTLANALAREGKMKKPCAQAVGRAVGSNPILLFLPCHRVVGKDGSLVGFRAGLAVKQALLRFEGHTVLDDRIASFKTVSI